MTLPHRIEAAEGADRALDGEIDRMINARPKDGDYDAHERAFWSVDDHSGLLVRANGFARDAFSALNYTASMDAALTLVPEEREWIVEAYTSNGVKAEHVRASAWVSGAPRCFAATPALALCAAALRAHNERTTHD